MKVSDEVVTILTGCGYEDSNVITLPDQLTRKQYLEVNKVLEAAGGKWNRKLKGHVFKRDPCPIVNDIIHNGQIFSLTKDADYYPTPKKLVKRMIKLAKLKPEHEVLEPSAGSGSISRRVAKLGCRVVCIEQYMDHNRLAKHANGVMRMDFLTTIPSPLYDRVLMNPPFSKGQDVKHVLHALGFLKPKGKLVAVMANGITFRQDKLYVKLRGIIEKRGGKIKEIEDGTFKDAGTMVKTVLVVIPAKKRSKKSD